MLSNEAIDGTYFLSQNPAIDAAVTIAGHAAPVLADLYTKPFLVVSGNDLAGQKKTARLRYIQLTVITPGATGTSDNWAAEVDTGVRFSSGGITRLLTTNPNQRGTDPLRDSNTFVIDCGPYVALAPTAAQRKMGHGVFRPAIAIAGDKYTFVFDTAAMAAITENNVVAGATTHHIVPMPPVALGPNDKFLLHLYAPGQSAAAVYKVAVGHTER